jgi:glycosyltransferase involved in cell wall biosynthesis
MVSVIIPLFNKEKSISSTIQSVLQQNYREFELVIVDDGSTDSSIDIIESFGDSRIKIFSKTNGGVSSARNYGIENALGEYIFFLDADDIIYPNCLEVLLHTSATFPNAGLLLCNFKVLFSSKKSSVFCKQKKDGYILNAYKSIWENQIFPRAGALLIKKNIITNSYRFDERVSVYEDLPFWMSLIKENPVAYTSQILHEYVTEYSELSKRLGPIEKEFAYYIRLNKSSNIYEKKILANIVYGSIASRIMAKKYSDALILVKNNMQNLFWILVMAIRRQLLKFNALER